MKRPYRWGLLVFLGCTILFADNTREYQRAQDYFSNHGVVYFSFPLSSNTDLDHLNSIVSLSHKEGQLMYAYANPKEFNEFLNENISYTVERLPGEDYDPSHVYSGDLKDFRGNQLLNYNEYLAKLQEYEKSYPTLCKVYSIGKSGKGKEMSCLRITSGISGDKYTKKPRFLFGCGVHGDELNGTLLSYGLMNFLLKGYADRDPAATKYLDGLEIWVAPHLNPDGTFPNGNTMSGCRRENGSGVDLNRDYPAPSISYDQYQRAATYAQAETQACMSFEKKHRFNFSVDYHDNLRAVVCHWSAQKVVPVEMSWMRYVAGKYTGVVGYTVGQAAIDWYVAVGTRMDWQPFYNHCWGFTIECDNKGTSPSATWSRHQSAIFALFDEAMCGIKGTVKDNSGNGLDNVKITLKKSGSTWDKNGTEAYSHEEGFYVHYAPAGTYDVEFTSGSKTRTITNVTVTNGQPTNLDVNMDNTDISTTGVLDVQKIAFVPYNGGIRISWNDELTQPSVSIYTANGSPVAVFNPKDQTTRSIAWKGNGSAATGCYVAVVTAGGKSCSKKFMLIR
ncbi:MAG: carboxypeptidase regulatory-like domain-containing protein [Chitinivibrionales bacterium]|nr:carboxypeptidase regulatory-like domain-containing protein [Chitinivibrionales bacterium]